MFGLHNDGEGASFAFPAFYLDDAMVKFHKFTAEGQPETGTPFTHSPCALHFGVKGKQVFHHIRRDAAAGVFNREFYSIVGHGGTQVYFASDRGKFNCVGKQVPYHSHDHIGIGPGIQQGRKVVGKPDFFDLYLWLKDRQCFDDNLSDVENFKYGVYTAGLGASPLQQVFNQTEGVSGYLKDVICGIPALGLVQMLIFGIKQFRESEDRLKGGFQVVGHNAEELILGFVQFVLLFI